MTIDTPVPHIALLGFGAIGRDLCSKLLAYNCQITVLLREGVEAPDQPPRRIRFVNDVNALLASAPSVVVEAAGQDALKAFCPVFLKAGIDVIAASVGGIADAAFKLRAAELSEQSGAQLIFSTGAVGGLDYLDVVTQADDLSVTYTSRKPVSAWLTELKELGVDPENMREAFVLYEGNAIRAAELYPRNLNAGLTIALAAGVARTVVRVVADPAVSFNTHEIEARSSFGEAFMRFANLPSPDNPKTSAITAASLLTEVTRYFAGRLIPAQ
ncbi:aspartate dehydrogenase [Brucella sp. NBRC 12950]|jgi:aspartate dehydrogenase|uniref:aspartate dehydrogenase n=1 Tax=Brucella sp. NBRC 12950 TaxID=2994518 RepID=UPI0024A3828E|nr:aspartate dehydrogenase [Brucella sp. NBRC 12950]GLU27385.1 putative L-aspartate dehydrogenase [Brucella sp. NBRC 12950]